MEESSEAIVRGGRDDGVADGRDGGQMARFDAAVMRA
jgi:hypothetical protein